jgi:hypothetical protein
MTACWSCLRALSFTLMIALGLICTTAVAQSGCTYPLVQSPVCDSKEDN